MPTTHVHHTKHVVMRKLRVLQPYISQRNTAIHYTRLQYLYTVLEFTQERNLALQHTPTQQSTSYHEMKLKGLRYYTRILYKLGTLIRITVTQSFSYHTINTTIPNALFFNTTTNNIATPTNLAFPAISSRHTSDWLCSVSCHAKRHLTGEFKSIHIHNLIPRD